MSTNTKIRAIITGATGMVGEGVLHECLQDPRVEAILVINRKPGGVIHPKLTELIHKDFFALSPVENQLTGYSACFFCLGVSSVGMSAADYYKLTYTLTLHVAETLSRLNPDMTFCYVSGAGTDSSEKGRSAWARVKGKTENDIRKLPFKQAFAFRPAYLQSSPDLKNTSSYYKYIRWLYPFLRRFFPQYACTLQELGLAMIQVTLRGILRGYPKPILEVPDIVALAKAG